jgi:isopenicillin N synthase-like dioxygenase
MFTVPTVDITAYVRDGSDDAKREVARAVDAACRSIGFIQVVGHGVPDDVVAGLTEAIDAFFGQDLEAKKRSVGPRSANRGYTPPKTESLSYSIGIDPVTRMNDFFEAFNIGVTPGDLEAPGADPADYPDNIWPGELPAFRGQLERYFAEARRVARTLTEVFADAIGVDQGVLAPIATDSLDVLRLNNYALPPSEIELGADLTGMGEHTDFGVVTVLWADQVAGLQVLDQDGHWHDVMPAEGALLVNIGDVMARITNDQWISTLHRVKPPVVDGRIQRRRSAAYFEDGNPSALVATIPCFVPAGTDPHYEPVTVHEHVTAKLDGLKSLRRNANAGREAARVARATAS